jgi:hypothetical protein
MSRLWKFGRFFFVPIFFLMVDAICFIKKNVVLGDEEHLEIKLQIGFFLLFLEVQ